MKSIKLTYKTREVCRNAEGVLLKEKTINFGPDPFLAGSQANTYAGRTMKRIQRDPAGFLYDLGYSEAPTEDLKLDIEVYMVVEDGKKKKEYFLFSLDKANQKNENKEKKIIKRLELKRSKDLLDHYKNLLKISATPEEVRNQPFPAPCFFRSREIKNEEGRDEIINQCEFRPEDYDNYVEMQRAAKSYHNNCISNLTDYDPLKHIQYHIGGSKPVLTHYYELYLVIIEEDQEHEILRLRNNSVNLDGMDFDLHLETLCWEDTNAFLEAKLQAHQERDS